MHTTKIATCCYCGTRAALVFDTGRHELTCGTCGAPLHLLKSLPPDRSAAGNVTGRLRSFDPSASRPVSSDRQKRRPVAPEKTSTKKREKTDSKDVWLARLPKSKDLKKLSSRRLLGKIWDAVEDIID